MKKGLLQKVRLIAGIACLCLAALVLGLAGYPNRGIIFDQSSASAQEAEKKEYEFNVLTEVISKLREEYAFQERLNPQAMFLAALAGVEDELYYVMVQTEPKVKHDEWGKKEVKEVTVSVYDASKTFELQDMNDLYKMNWKLVDALTFVAQHSDEKVKNIEEAAIDGMLSVLDPHTDYMNEQEYKEMALSTTGKFGGIGIVISVREGKLKVISVLDNTPAQRAGLKAGDHIVQIDDESTVNMTVTEAANRLRGKPGTKVTVWIMREGFEQPKKFEITREIIKVKSVVAQALPGGVAYVRVKNFSRRTALEVENFLNDNYKESEPKGIILDLRGNSGGVLSAAVDLADLFIGKGRIVTSVGARGEILEEHDADSGDRFEDVPIVLLVDHGSASASEIVTAALKYHDRALVIGRRTFGKGSIQYLHKLKRGALKLTVAQYIGPHGETIQTVGVWPHIDLVNTYMRDNKIVVRPLLDQFEGESALSYHLEKEVGKVVADVPVYYVRYVPRIIWGDEDAYDKPKGDFPVLLAWTILSRIGDKSAQKMLAKVEPILEEAEEVENWLIDQVAALDDKTWHLNSAAENVNAYEKVDISVAVDPKTPKEGDEFFVTLTVHNRSKSEIPGVYAYMNSTYYLLDEKGCVLGDLQPGQASTCKIKFRLPKGAGARRENVDVAVYSALNYDELLATTSFNITTEKGPAPRIEFSFVVDDSNSGNGDGLFQVGEECSVVMNIENKGNDELDKGLATIKSLSGGALFVKKGRYKFDNLKQNKTIDAQFEVAAKKEPEEKTWKVRLSVVDLSRRTELYKEFELPLVEGITKSSGTTYYYVTKGSHNCYLYPGQKAPLVGYFEGPGSVIPQFEFGDWLGVKTDSRVVWLKKSEVSEVSRPLEGTARFVMIPLVAEPKIVVTSRQPNELEGTSKSIRLEGYVDWVIPSFTKYDPALVVYDNEQKVAVIRMKPEKGTSKCKFDVTVELEKGNNVILLMACMKKQSCAYTKLFYDKKE